MKPLIECIPNFSEGNDPKIISEITKQIESVKGIKLLNVDIGKAANRTVVTFAGSPDAVVGAAFKAIKKAATLIDMSKHKGVHPRIGATDVCPLVPLSGISIEETAEYAKTLGERVGEELKIPVFLYEAAQSNKERSNLSEIRKGEYEGMFRKIELPEWKPDFGPAKNNTKAGATVIGARDFLVAYNVNLKTSSIDLANLLAAQVRETGYIKKEKIRAKDRTTTKTFTRVPGSLKSVKAIGWYIKEYGFTQVSMNLTNLNVTPIHIAFEEVKKKAAQNNIQVTGSELIGLIPLKAMLDAGKYFLKKQHTDTNLSEQKIIEIAIQELGLNQLSPFDPQKRIIEYVMSQ